MKKLLFVLLMGLVTMAGCIDYGAQHKMAQVMQNSHRIGCNDGMWSTTHSIGKTDLMHRRTKDSIWFAEAIDFVPGDAWDDLSMKSYMAGWKQGSDSILNRKSETWPELLQRDSIAYYKDVVVDYLKDRKQGIKSRVKKHRERKQ
jgi:hypothetical protein